MSHSRFSMRGLWIIAVCALLSGNIGISHAASDEGCAPAYADTLPVVDTGLPVVQIWTNAGAPILDRENYIKACMRITDGSVKPYKKGLFHGTIKIRGRGNSTWGMPKKGYRVKLDEATQVLDMPEHRDWVLVANYSDKTLMRNAIAMELSERVGLPWTPRLRYAEFYLNDEFLGNYLLGEKIEVAKKRVKIKEMSTEDTTFPNVSGGYLLEADFLSRIEPADRYFTTAERINFVLKSPSDVDVTDEQFNYISTYTQAVESAIVAHNDDKKAGYPSLIDVDSFIDWFLVQEFMKNVDARFGSSVYVVKERKKEMAMGPVWDFDLAAGNVNYQPLAKDPDGWYIGSGRWFRDLRQDEEFAKRLAKRWKKVRKDFEGIDKYIAELDKQLEVSQAKNFQRWPILDTYVWPNAVVLGSHEAEVAYLSAWLRKRFEWMDQNIGNDDCCQ